MNNLAKSVAMLLLAGVTTQGQLIISDNYNANSGTTRGFLLGEGINFGINPPTTRLTGAAAPGLSYLYTQTGTAKATTNYRITGGKASIAASANSGRFSLSADGATPFDFASALGATAATAANPVVYDVSISMANNVSGAQRFSFSLSTAETTVDAVDFGIQLYRAAAADTTYQVGRRIDTLSIGLADVNTPIATTETYGSELSFRLRFTDAGAETGSDYHSRVQLFMNDTEIYDTKNDATLVNGWRFDGAGRYFVWDQAGASGATGSVTYDNFSVVIVPEPSTLALGLLAGAACLIRRRC